MRIDIVSLFPDYFRGPFDESMIARARRQGLLEINLVDLRRYGVGHYRQVDDRAYGGGPGMVLMAEPVTQALREAKAARPEATSKTIFLSPQGMPLQAKKCRELAESQHLILLCGHYEGVDQRVLEREIDEEISIGDYVLTNGCLPAIVLVDAVARFIPGVIGHSDAAAEDSFERELLDCPHYTRPESFEGIAVPEVLLEGNHAAIGKWRLEQAIAKTRLMRPDLMARYLLRHQEGGEGRAEVEGVQLSTLTLLVKDARKSRRFYRDLLGVRPIREDENTIVFALGKTEVALTEGVAGSENQPPVILGVELDDPQQLERIARRVQQGEKGGVEAREEVEKVWFIDPDGYHWILSGSYKV